MNSFPDKVRSIIGKLIAAESGGISVPDQRVIARHPELADELPEALYSLERIRAAELESFAAGSIEKPLEIYSEDELSSPIDLANTPTDDSADSLQSLCGSIQGYKIIEPIGQGGQASVYRAKRISTGGMVAIKVLPGGYFATTRAKARFDREVQAMVRINHPNVVPVLDRGRTQDGSQFIVMEFVEGLPLDQFLRPSTAEITIAGIFSKIADAVQELHRCGIVHRDLKPSNVLVDRYGQPHVLDFGLARMEDAPGVTDTGQVLGSIPWASPEQAAGRIGDVNECSDIYAIGVMLAYVLDGKAPYPTFGPPHETIRHICNTPPRIGQGRDPSVLDAVALKCLAKIPSGRYESAGELCEHFRHIVAGDVTPITPRKKLSRKMLILIATTLSLVITAIEISHIQRLNASADPKAPSALSNQLIDLPHFTNSIDMQFNEIPAGVFTMGNPVREPNQDPGEEPRLVRIDKPFYLAVTETTQAAYEKVMQTNPSDSRFRGPDLPVQMITYKDAIEFCARLRLREGHTYRLPTEEEWEYACRASSDTKLLSDSDLSAIAWWTHNSNGIPHRVAKLSPNRWGIFDMLGGVAEWCALSTPPSASSIADGSAVAIIKGGGFDSPARSCRIAARFSTPLRTTSSDLGFRVVAERWR